MATVDSTAWVMWIVEGILLIIFFAWLGWQAWAWYRKQEK